MRTTLDIDDDVLGAVKELASREKKSAGKVLSELARTALVEPVAREAEQVNGFRLLPAREGIITSEIVSRLESDDDLGQAD